MKVIKFSKAVARIDFSMLFVPWKTKKELIDNDRATILIVKTRIKLAVSLTKTLSTFNAKTHRFPAVRAMKV